MVIGCNKSRGTGAVVSCVVLSLALLLVGAAEARNIADNCRAHCNGRANHKSCHAFCLWGVRLGAHGRIVGEKAVGGIRAPSTCRVRCRHADDIDACVKRCRSEIEGEEARGGGGVAGLLVAMPTEEDGEKKKKEADASPFELAWDPEFCSFMCRHIHDQADCLQKCEEAGPK